MAKKDFKYITKRKVKSTLILAITLSIFYTITGMMYGGIGEIFPVDYSTAFEIDPALAISPDSNSKTVDSLNKSLKYPIRSSSTGTSNPYSKTKSNSMDLKNPNAVENSSEMDSSGKNIIKSSKVNGEEVGSSSVPFKEQQQSETKDFVKDYFRKRSLSQGNIVKGGTSLSPNVLKDQGLFGDLFGGLVDIRPTGSAELIFGVDVNRIANPNWPIREQRNTQFKFDQKLQLNVMGNIGNRIKLGINYNTESSFDFQNQRKVNYIGQEDEIIKSFDLGDVSMPISNSLITGSQSLFGVKTKLQFGKLFVEGIYAQNRGERKEIVVENGAQKTNFNITADNYDVNRNFLLGHYFQKNYNNFNKLYPGGSNITITRLQVWVTNSQNTITNSRTAIAFMDLGESRPYNTQISQGIGQELPDNNSNSLYARLTGNARYRNNATAADELDGLKSQNYLAGQDYVKIDNARLLQASEYTIDQRRGFISLNFQPRPNDVIGVAYEYTVNGRQYAVGEIAQDVAPDPSKPNVLFLKMLKSNITYTRLPIWDLMMKNVYSLNTYQLSSTDFKLQVIYEDNTSGSFLNYLPVPSEKGLDGIPLNRVLLLDRFNSLGEAKPDGNFDFLAEANVLTNSGKIIFPVLEPFGNDLRAKFIDKTIANNYTYDSLYRSTRAIAIQQTNRNKFYLRGSYQGTSGSEISLNAINVPQGSVKVYAGGQELRENVDYTVDYGIGRVKIINPGIIASGSVLRVSLESQSLFSIQQKTLMGGRAEYRFNKNFFLGATFLKLRERPLTPKVNVGDEPIANSIFGFDGSYSTESRFLTKLVDKLPFHSTKAKSTIIAKAEYAQIIPGHPNLLNDPSDASKTGVSYLDDFEAAEVPYDLRLGNYWVLSSTPEGVAKLPEANFSNDLRYGFNRAKLAWYSIDPLFFRNNNLTPPNFQSNKTLQSNHYQREVLETEVFPNKQLPSGVPGTLTTFDLSYYPNQRGQYNYNVDDLNEDGTLKNPDKRWAGIMRRIETSDFEAANIQYIEFWLMDPFMYNKNHKGGELNIQIGNLSEDILKDRVKFYENGLPKTDNVKNVDTTAWGRVSSLQQINSAFETDATARRYQDVGFDGLGPVGDGGDERSFFQKTYIDKIEAKFGKNSKAYINAVNDPSNDNFHFYTGDDLDKSNAEIYSRYKKYNNMEGNTPVSTGNQAVGYGTQYPDDEDINRDFTLNTVPEQYFEYKIKITPEDLTKSEPNLKNFCTTVLKTSVALRNNTVDKEVYWYQFKIPVNEFTRRFGNITDFRSIQYMRMYMTGWEDSTTLRFGQLQLVRGEWRPYLFDLERPGEYIPIDDRNTQFTLSSVSLERNGNRRPPYVSPPGIQRTIDPSTPDQIQQNEQALSMSLCNLRDGDARGVFKNTTFDIRLYKKLKMFVHAEGQNLKDNDATVFIRIGTDLNSNFYEYEMPLKVTALNERSKDGIWPADNSLLVTLADFYNAKQRRNVAKLSLIFPYLTASSDGKGKITVLGNPDLSNIKSILIGIRNPKDDANPDGKSICGEFWVNELRVTDFDEQGGWAANASIRAQLADFASITLSGQRRTIGFGSIEQTVQQRSQKDVRGYDITTTLEADKLFPKNFYLKLPVYYSFSELINRPRFSPLAPDLSLASTLDAYSGDQRRYDSVRSVNEEYTRRQTLSINNFKKEKNPNRKLSFPTDISNFNFTYAFGEIFKRSLEKEYDVTQDQKGIIAYLYTFPAKPWEPFKKLGTKKVGKYTKLISDFNLYYLPQSWSFTFEGNRHYSEILYRNTDNYKAIVSPLFDKNFKLNRNYTFRYNLSKSFRISYNANAMSYIPEAEGKLDTKEKKSQFIDSLKSLGKLNNYNQSTQVNYDVPINKLPFMDWVTTNASYTGYYDWKQAFPATPQYGNTISNSATIGGTGNFNFQSLFSKSKFLKNILSGQGNAPVSAQSKNANGQTLTKAEIAQQKKDAKKKKKISRDKNGKIIKDSTQSPGKSLKIGAIKFVDGVFRVITSLRTVQVSYNQTDATTIPGFLPTPKYIGISDGSVSSNFGGAPGYPFVFGFQEDIRSNAAKNGWITRDTNLASLYQRLNNKNLNINATLEPFKNFRITLTAQRRESQNLIENFRFKSNSNEPVSFGAVTTGSFSTSILPISTAFSGSAPFQKFEQLYRKTIAERLAAANPQEGNRLRDSAGFPVGFRKTSQEVLLYSFLAAYQGKDPNTIKLNAFPSIPLPNWNVQWTGLSDIPAIKKVAKNITFSHAYRSNYTVGNYVSSLNYSTDSVASAASKKGLRPQYIIENVNITEDFSPLLGIDVQWVSGWTTKMEYKKSRNVSVAFTNLQLNEQRNEEFVFGAGYRTNKFRMPFKVRGKRRMLTNDLSIRADFSYRNSINDVRVIDQGTSQASQGNRIIQIKPNIQYNLSKSLLLNIFWTSTLTKPYVSTQYPTSNTSAGFSLRYTLTP